MDDYFAKYSGFTGRTSRRSALDNLICDLENGYCRFTSEDSSSEDDSSQSKEDNDCSGSSNDNSTKTPPTSITGIKRIDLPSTSEIPRSKSRNFGRGDDCNSGGIIATVDVDTVYAEVNLAALCVVKLIFGNDGLTIPSYDQTRG